MSPLGSTSAGQHEDITDLIGDHPLLARWLKGTSTWRPGIAVSEQDVPAPENLILKPTLVVRQSSGPASRG